MTSQSLTCERHEGVWENELTSKVDGCVYKFHTPVTVAPFKDLPVPTEEKAMCILESIWMLQRRVASLPPVCRKLNLVSSVAQPWPNHCADCTFQDSGCYITQNKERTFFPNIKMEQGTSTEALTQCHPNDESNPRKCFQVHHQLNIAEDAECWNQWDKRNFEP